MVGRICFLMLGCKRLLSVYWFTCLQNENTPLKLAAEKGHINIVKKLISMKADVNKADKVIVSLFIHYVITFFIVLKGSPGKSKLPDWFLLGSYFATQTISMEVLISCVFLFSKAGKLKLNKIVW